MPRRRPSTGELVAPIPFGSASTFAYSFPPGSEVRDLRAAALPQRSPLLHAALDKAEPSVGLARYIDAIEVTGSDQNRNHVLKQPNPTSGSARHAARQDIAESALIANSAFPKV